MMTLQSRLFRDDKRLQRCLIDHSAHVTPGSAGDFVTKIQTALILADDLTIARSELDKKTYGQSTTEAVLAFKQRRKIINRSYESKVDDIVGKMTIAALDKEMLRVERTCPTDIQCQFVRDPNSPA
jgi:hypothetical protein